MVASPPEVTSVRYGAVAAWAPGTIAVAYHGSTDGVAYRGYMGQSADALGGQPRFDTAAVDPPDEPLYPHGFDPGYTAMFLGGDLNEHVQVAYGPDGDAFASFARQVHRWPSVGFWHHRLPVRSTLDGVLGRLSPIA